MNFTLRRTSLSDRPDDFIFRYNGIDVGRTYAQLSPLGARWLWTIYGSYLRTIPAEVALQGQAETLEEAKAAFKKNWERLQAAGSIRLPT